MGKKCIVISAINLREGGCLSILRDCLKYISGSTLPLNYRIVALVHKKDLFDYSNIEYIEFPKSINSYLLRFYYEYFYFRKISKKLNPYLWLSLHDMTPNVVAERRAVYMHNPSAFQKIKISDFKFDKTYIIFSFLYKYIYRINVKKNNWCIVQQKWLKESLSKILNVSEDKFIVSYPENRQNVTEKRRQILSKENKIRREKTGLTLFYPSLPRPFKNFEIICEAAKLLEKKYPQINFYLTINGSENSYSKWIYKKYKFLKNVKFIGLVPYNEMQQWYSKSDALIFPSRLETWGLPISEFKSYEKPMILADLPYAKETSQGAPYVRFFNSEDASQLAEIIIDLYNQDFSQFCDQPFTKEESIIGFEDLFDKLLAP